MKHILRAGLAAFVLLPGPVAAAEYWEFRDWRVSVDEIDTGEDLRRTCRASTGGDGLPVLSVEFSNGDAGPPDFYPPVVIGEHAVRNFQTVMRDGAAVSAVFDDGDGAAATAYGWVNEDGFEEAEASFGGPDALLVLQAMRRNGVMDITTGGKLVLSASLNGFTAAYLKIAEQCGFSAEGVVD